MTSSVELDYRFQLNDSLGVICRKENVHLRKCMLLYYYMREMHANVLLHAYKCMLMYYYMHISAC